MRAAGAPPSHLTWMVATWVAWAVTWAAGDLAAAAAADDAEFVFTRATYNGSIYENTFGKKYIETRERMGIQLSGRLFSLEVEYSIIDGDKHDIFKAETVAVEDFCFLRIRTRTGRYGMLNRELNSAFYLKVKATGSSPALRRARETFTDVVVVVKDHNEFSPLFSSLPYDVSIPEDTPLHTSIAQVKASDADTGVNGEIYYSLQQATLVFAIHPTTGIVTLSRPVPYDRRHDFELDVVARDRGTTAPRRDSPNSKTKLRIKILPVNYHAPTINVHNHQTLVEHGNLDSVFAVLTISDVDKGRNGKINRVAITNDERSVFRLMPQNTDGMYNIVVNSPVDRETMPEDYNITIIATDGGVPQKTATVSIPIRVQDVNDNAPEFEHAVYNVNVSEVVLPNTAVLFVRAHDKDLGSNAEVRYSIVDGNDRDMFSIDPASGLIKTASQLDSELARKMTLVVQAEDQATSGSRKTGQARVIVNVEDYNDNTPVFNLNSHHVTVRENLPKGSRVVTVEALDDDAGDNGKLSYSIVNYDAVPFEIDAFTGEITTKEVLDFETMRRMYELHVRVADWGSPFRREEDVSLTVRVEDVNDNSPEFEKIRCSGYLSRQSPLNTHVITLTAIDFDSGDTVSYSITDGNGDDCFSIVPNTGSVTVNCDMSGYRDGTRTLTVVASDGQYVSIPVTVKLTLVNNKRNPVLASDDVRIKCDHTDVILRLEDQTQTSHEANAKVKSVGLDTEHHRRINSAPVIDGDFSTYAEVSENADVGTEVLDFGHFVSDTDSGFNGQLTYVISSGDDQGAFRLDSFTGKLLVMSKLDKEKKSDYTLTLTVADLGESPLSLSREVQISVLDENDNVPQFEKPLYELEVSEDTAVDTSLLTVRATDLDTGANARIRYAILSDDRDFRIDPVRGIISIRRSLDRETRPRQTLVVQAEDSGRSARLASTATVNITITDVNDNVPLFVPAVYTVRVREDLPEGAVITTLTAHDLDQGDNGRVSYSFAEGMPRNFEIDPLTGSVRIRRRMDYEQIQVYNLTGVAVDAGHPARSSSCSLLIEVMDVDENLYGPEFPEFLSRASVSENSPIGSYVTQVEAKDNDDWAHGVGQITYTIQGGSGVGRFTMDSVGAIRTSQVLDRETRGHYWLTIIAQDRALVPRFARLELLITVDDVNDNIPQSLEPAYYASVPENLKGSVKRIVQIQASDGDYAGTQHLTYRITGGNSGNFFAIDADTGVITSTTHSLDREKRDEHALEVTISDKGSPPLSSTTRVIIKVVDENDNKPVFINRVDTIFTFATNHTGEDIFIYRAVAFDADEGRNAEVTYILKNAKRSQLRVDAGTGKIFSKADLLPGQTFDVQIKAVDGGVPPRRSQIRLYLKVVPRRAAFSGGNSRPSFPSGLYQETITESDRPRPGGLIQLLQAEDADGDRLMYSFTGGNENDAFTIHPNHGSVFQARRVDSEGRNLYNLTVQATDGLASATTTLLLTVVDTNDHEPVFTRHLYQANISESAALGSPVVRVSATDQDRGGRFLYSIESSASTRSKDMFKIGATDGSIVVADTLDREDLSRHLLTVMVRDKGVIAKRSFARVQINLLDHNDHKPRFLTPALSGRVYETAAVGTSVLRMEAVDQDKGENGRILYSIVSGNADNTFSIDPELGILSLAKALNRQLHPHFSMVAMATDCGVPALSSRVEVTIDVTVSSNSPPRFAEPGYVAELTENRPAGTVVLAVFADSLSTVTYRIVAGDTGGFFTMNPNSGVVSTTRPVDYEQIQFFNLTLTATSVVSAESTVSLLVHVLDVNDNAPEFSATSYTGSISEAALQGSMVLSGDAVSGSPLVVKAADGDSGANAHLFYQIPEEDARQLFAVDPNTGAVRIIANLDYETKTEYTFTVQVRDKGEPELQASTAASVTVYVLDVNDCPPRFDQDSYRVQLLLPTYPQVHLLTVHAVDLDSEKANDKPLHYSLSSGNDENIFSLDAVTGTLVVKNDSPRSNSYHLNVAVSDGKFTMMTQIVVTVQQAGESTIKFTQESYTAKVPENKPTASQLVIIQPVMVNPGRHVTFTLLNNHAHFSVGRTSGVLSTTGLEFDREEQESYTVVVKVDDTSEKELSAHVVVLVNVTDENDNLPMFVKLPYHCTVSGQAERGEVIQKVQAVDPDLGQNGLVDYRLADSLGERFAINPYTREIIVKRLSREDYNKELVLKVIAQDRGSPSLTAVASVHIHVTDSSSPLFEKPMYTGRILENAAPHTAIIPVSAVSPHGQKLLYSISRGDKYGDFALDFNIGYLSVVGQLDYEMKKSYELVVRATDIFTGSYGETKVKVEVEDVNDNAPVFTSMTYSRTLSESAALGSPVLQVCANDSDSEANALVYYQLAPSVPGQQDVQHFQVDSETGEIILRKTLDHETQSEFSFLVIARDGGMPSRNATATVNVKVLDLNDNAPVFTQPSYDCYISDLATRGQLVFKVVAFDPDDSDIGHLTYSIVGGDEHSTFAIDATTGAISLSEQRHPALAAAYTLNVSVSDKVYTSFSRVTVDVRNANSHTPVFSKEVYVMDVTEESGYGEGHVLARASAEDADRGNYGMLTYSILNDEMKELFSIDADTGEVTSKRPLDREEKAQYSFTVCARDNGGRTGFAQVLLRVRDVNDHRPQFLAEEFHAVVKFNASIGTPILKVEAQDEDAGDNARLAYSINQDPSIVELFDLNADTGEITTKASLIMLANKVFQFFVQVVDHGEPALENHVPVEIVVTDGTDKVPIFRDAEKIVIVDENKQVGSIIDTVRAGGPSDLIYSEVPGFTNATNRPSTFTVDSLGQIQLKRRLDRERTPVYFLTVRAETRGSPPLVDYLKVVVQVRDVNDNPPRFTCSPYELTVPEDAPAQHKLVQIQSTDKDTEVLPLRYAFGPGMEELSSVFSLAGDTGWLTLLTPLDREVRSFYNLSVLVWDTPDSIGRRSDVSLTATTSVLITVIDVNDNAPTFQSGSSVATAVNEGALPGTVLLTLETEDKDLDANADVTFYITEGDHLDQFEVYRSGELLVNRELDRETIARYRLLVAATDGAHVSFITVTIDVLDDNDNVPVCEQPVYQSVQNEDITKHTVIVQVAAHDADAPGTIHSQITYSLKPEEGQADSFVIDSRTGVIRSAKLLDRESMPELHLSAVATDGGGLSCSVSVIVLLKDVNDNVPVFPASSLREAYNIKEDAELHTLLTRVAATDADIGINSHVRYGLTQRGHKVFDIDPDTGIISLAAGLDREKHPHYDLTVSVYNVIAPDLSSEATLRVDVLDVNDNPPQFERSNYHSAIEESAQIGTVVTKVRATSLDIGVNADITYSLVAGNEQGKFSIHGKKGEVTVSEPLDHELSPEYFLTVLATDQGSPPLTASTVLSVNVTDINDNAPRFSQNAYTLHVSEAARVGTEIFRVLATDSDSAPNAKISYSIIDGDPNSHFIIDPYRGIMQVNAPLDRETTASYSLVIQAHDSGLPLLFSSAVVSILVDDANDNPPRFSQSIYRGLVQEGRRTGIEILTVSVTDADLPENGPPFHLEIVEGNQNGEFHIDTDGLISTAGKLSKHVKDTYNLTVRAYDSGKPSLSSDTLVEISVVNDSLHPPQVENMSINIRSCSDNFFGGVIGRVTARDLDPYDKLVFTIVSPNSHLFDIHRFDGRLIALTGLDTGHYVVNASVSDGKFTSYAKVDVYVVCTSKEMLSNAVTIQFENLSEEQFYTNFKDDFRRVLKHELGVRTRDVEIINVQPSSESMEGMDHVLPANVLVASAAANTQQEASQSAKRRRKRSPSQYDAQRGGRSTSLDVLFAVRKSSTDFIPKQALKRKVKRVLGRIESKLGVAVADVFEDTCRKDTCDIGSCVAKVEFDESTLVPVNANGASFVSARHRYVQQCVCLEGDCAHQVCGDTTCTANTVCQRIAFGDYVCQCPEGRTGHNCEDVVPLCSGNSCPIERPMTFAGKSYAKWRLKHSTKKRFSLRLRVRTRQTTAVLMYAKGKVDYSILQIERGSLVYKFDCGSGEGHVRIPVALSDGQWHTIRLERNGREAELSLDAAYTALGIAPGVHAILNVDTEELFFGAEVDVFPNGYRDIGHGFEGCMEDIRVFDIPLPFKGNNLMAQALEFEKVKFHCQDYPVRFLPGDDACSSNPCLNGGQCQPSGNNAFVCICPGEFKGQQCELDPDPCQQRPCVGGGRCEKDSESPNSYLCHCPSKLMGARCSYGSFCLPNPCQHEGICVEGPTAPLCDCQPGYEGLYCEKTVNPCDSSPCHHGGTCHTMVGGAYFCNCTAEFTGNNCELTFLVPGRITSSSSTTLYWVLGALAAILFIVLIIVVCLLYYRRHRSRREKQRINRQRRAPTGLPEGSAGTQGLLSGGPGCLSGSSRLHGDDDNVSCGGGGGGMEGSSKEEKLRCKLSNPDLTKAIPSLPSQPPPVPTRPASYTPSTHDSFNALNNLDGVRDYGSAADELENSGTGPRGHIPDFYQYVEGYRNPVHSSSAHPLFRATPPPPHSRAASESDSIQKQPWEFEYPNILENYMEGDTKQHSKLASKQMPGLHSPHPSPAPSLARRTHAPAQVVEATSVSSLPVSESEDDLNGYHWDTSDWAPGPSMPNISEIPTNEILDSPSSSQPSDDCNANAGADAFDDNITTRGIYNMSLGDDHSPLLSSDEQHQNKRKCYGNYNDDEDDDDDDDEENVISRLEMDDYFDDSEYVGDSEYAENEPYDQDDLPPSYAEHPRYEQFLQNLDDSYEMPEALINRQPLHYLPDHFSASHQELAIDPLTEDEDERDGRERLAASGLPPPPLPQHLDRGAGMMLPDRQSYQYTDEDEEQYPRLRPPKEFMTPGYMTDSYTTDKDQPSNRTSFVDDLSLSMGGFNSNASLSDISGLCEIEDSEINASDTDDENTPCLGPGLEQTQL